ncbi:hypothetical protein SAMN04487944_111134 [Gracilibacillus ureilyticus]|uniref:Uncharacterized protein n=1 Tax=Gracilibacillus ureilyticus TaxID=531814 RepID=A0A1H9SPT6_9BACI|nr:hypothetical protein [Gracilibacillus ureilyticus]SER87020.1 hypothetical protein SAMN04487944_111134 [Gracilibacillus ureilyticus]
MRILIFLLPLFALFLNIFGLMRLIPMYLTIPLLFITIYMSVYFYFDRKKFKGFRKRLPH